MIKPLLLSIFFTLNVSFCFSQNDIAGIWQGQFLENTWGLGAPKLVIEIFDVKGESFAGVTHLYYDGGKYEHYKMVGWYSKKEGILVLREATTIAVDLGEFANCLGTYTTALKTVGNNLQLHGFWTANVKNCTTNSNVWLQKRKIVTPWPQAKVKAPVTKPTTTNTNKPDNKIEEIKKNTEVVIVPDAKEKVEATTNIKNSPIALPLKVTQRQTDLQQLLEIAVAEKDSIKIELYDNGEIDGDTVSLFYEAQQLANKKLITDKPLTFYVSLSKTMPIQHLRLVAESLGSIPPCTALMVVTTQRKRYEVRLSSNYKKNAAVELFLKE
jgi:hypothetical protein